MTDEKLCPFRFHITDIQNRLRFCNEASCQWWVGYHKNAEEEESFDCGFVAWFYNNWDK